MKKKIFFMMLLLAGICFSCSNADSSEDVYNLPEQTQQTRSVDASKTKWGKALASVIEKKDKSDYTSDYIVYSPKDDECETATEDSYIIAISLLALVSKDSITFIPDEQLINEPQSPNNDGWVYVGKEKGKMGISIIRNKLENMIPKGPDFEIRIIYDKDRSYNVFWRPLK